MEALRFRPSALYNCCKVSLTQLRCVGKVSSVPSDYKVEKDLKQNVDARYQFCKNIFRGKFDNAALTYPEVLDSERVAAMEENIKSLKNYFEDKVNSSNISTKECLVEESIKVLKDLRLFGLRMPVVHERLALQTTEFAQILETIAVQNSIADVLSSHEVGLQAILMFGNSHQKTYYLPLLASGDWISSFCLTETDFSSDMGAITTRATLSHDKKTWNITGVKKWVANAHAANIFIVPALTEIEVNGQKKEECRLFIVERGLNGISIGKSKIKFGLQCSPRCEVIFSNTPVPAGDVLDKMWPNFEDILEIATFSRFCATCCMSGVMKKLVNVLTEFSSNKTLHGKQLQEFGILPRKLAEITCKAYAVESMIYLTAGFMDTQDNPDYSLESAIMKVFTAESLNQSVDESHQIFGNNAYIQDFPYEQIMRDTQVCTIPEDGNDALRLFISRAGIEYAESNPLNTQKKINFSFLKKIFKTQNYMQNLPKSTLGLHYYLHPSLETSTNYLELCVLNFRLAVEFILEHNMKECERKLHKLSDIIIYIYAMTAVLGRASRSYCIGLQWMDYEVLIANRFCLNALREVQSRLDYIMNDDSVTDNSNYQIITQRLYQDKGYFMRNSLNQKFNELQKVK